MTETMKIKGLPEKMILEELQSKLRTDFNFKSGRIIGSMCTSPHPLARKVFSRYLEKNLGDSGLFPAATKIEKETIRMLGMILSNPKASGHIVTGGTEANILALWAAKKLSGKALCQVIVPASAHCSFDKAGDLLGLRIVRAKLNDRFQVDVEAIRKALNSKTIAIVGIAGTTGLGVVDPIDELSELAVKNNLYLHVDAAFGGFVLPFLKDLGYNVHSFDFSLPGVNSITVDPHKMGMAPIPAGGILFRNENLRKTVSWDIPYLSGGETEHATLVGTRSGASAAAVYAVINHLGREGYRKIVKECMRLTLRLAEEIPRITGLKLTIEPTMNVIGLTSDSFNVQQIAQELREKGWAVSLFPDHIRIVIMPHVKEMHVQRLLQDLNIIVRQLRR